MSWRWSKYTGTLDRRWGNHVYTEYDSCVDGQTYKHAHICVQNRQADELACRHVYRLPGPKHKFIVQYNYFSLDCQPTCFVSFHFVLNKIFVSKGKQKQPFGSILVKYVGHINLALINKICLMSWHLRSWKLADR